MLVIVKSLCSIPETNIISCVSYTQIKKPKVENKNKQVNKYPGVKSVGFKVIGKSMELGTSYPA